PLTYSLSLHDALPICAQSVHRKLSFTLMGIAPVLLLFISLCGMGIFFFLPRISAGFMSAESGANDITTGFSDRVELGRIGQIQQDRKSTRLNSSHRTI